MGIAALPHWAVDSFEKQGLIKTKTLGSGLWSRLYAACREGEQRQPAIETFINTATNHAVENLSYVKSVRGSNAYAPTETQLSGSSLW
ncbi:DNA-binding transcriptional regulator MetR [Providencia rustigianii]|nr:DNA-binding transcriptional regulator MetR [Providencia rustigianii]